MITAIFSISLALVSLILYALPIKSGFGKFVRILLGFGISALSVYSLPPLLQLDPTRLFSTGSLPAEHLHVLFFLTNPLAQVGGQILYWAAVLSVPITVLRNLIGILKDLVDLVRGPQKPPPPPYPPGYPGR